MTHPVLLLILSLLYSSASAAPKKPNAKRGIGYPAANNPADVKNFNQSQSQISWVYDWGLDAPQYLADSGGEFTTRLHNKCMLTIGSRICSHAMGVWEHRKLCCISQERRCQSDPRQWCIVDPLDLLTSDDRPSTNQTSSPSRTWIPHLQLSCGGSTLSH